jgi:hypothetical protein
LRLRAGRDRLARQLAGLRQSNRLQPESIARAVGGARQELIPWRPALCAVSAARPSLGPASQNSLRALGAPSVQTTATSQLTKCAKARPAPGRTSQPPQKSPPPGTAAAREVVRLRCVALRCVACVRPLCKGVSGQAGAHRSRGACVCSIPWQRAQRASLSDSPRLFERSAPSGRVVSSAAATGSSKRREAGAQHRPPRGCARGLPGHAFAARGCLANICDHLPRRPWLGPPQRQRATTAAARRSSPPATSTPHAS